MFENNFVRPSVGPTLRKGVKYLSSLPIGSSPNLVHRGEFVDIEDFFTGKLLGRIFNKDHFLTLVKDG